MSRASEQKRKIEICVLAVVSLALLLILSFSLIGTLKKGQQARNNLRLFRRLAALQPRDYPAVLRRSLDDNLGLACQSCSGPLKEGISDLPYKAAFYFGDTMFPIYEKKGQDGFVFADESRFPEYGKDSELILQWEGEVPPALRQSLEKGSISRPVKVQIGKEYVLEYLYQGNSDGTSEQNERAGKERLLLRLPSGAGEIRALFSLDRIPSVYEVQEELLARTNMLRPLLLTVPALVLPVLFLSLCVFPLLRRKKACLKKEKKEKEE